MSSRSGPYSERDLLEFIRRAKQRDNEDIQRLQAARAKEIRDQVESKKSGEPQHVTKARYPWWVLPPNPPSGFEQQSAETGVRQIYVRAGDMKAVFKNIRVYPHRDLIGGDRNGIEYLADAFIAQNGGWWVEADPAQATPETTARGTIPMKDFTEKILLQGQYDELERVTTPKPREQFDLNRLAVACVLTLNKAVEVIAEMQERIEALEQEREAQRAIPAEPAFRLNKIGDSYDDVRKVG